MNSSNKGESFKDILIDSERNNWVRMSEDLQLKGEIFYENYKDIVFP